MTPKKLGPSVYQKLCKKINPRPEVVRCSNLLVVLVVLFSLFPGQSFDLEENYLMYDSQVMAYNFVNDLAFLTNNWSTFLGRPTVVVSFNSELLQGNHTKSINQKENSKKESV